MLIQIEERVGEDGDVLDVFRADGVFLGTISAGFPIDPQSTVAFRGDTMVAVRRDEFGVSSVVRATLVRPGRRAAVRSPGGLKRERLSTAFLLDGLLDRGPAAATPLVDDRGLDTWS